MFCIKKCLFYWVKAHQSSLREIMQTVFAMKSIKHILTLYWYWLLSHYNSNEAYNKICTENVQIILKWQPQLFIALCCL